jgi:N-methylhydantoinase B/oxoprolinase/acetone carboxylase alpha subunit
MPIFCGGELVAWVGAVTHELEIGGVHGGANMQTVAERFGQGLTISAEKVGSNDEIRRDFLIRAEMNLRTPIYFILDEKAMVSACIEVRERVLEIVEEYGLDFYKQGIREVIEEGRMAHLERMKLQTVPGRYRSPAFCGHLFSGKAGASTLSRDLIVHAPVEMRIDGDGFMDVDFEGSGSAMWNPYNCPPAAMDGGFFVTLTQFMDFDGKVNDGCYLATKTHLPPGSWCNPGDHLTVTSSAWSSLIPAFGCLQRMMSRSFLARGFYEEIFLGQCNTPVQEVGGINQYGQRFGGQNIEAAAEGSGARGVMDGIDCGYVGWNPESDLGNVEIWEQTMPILYLGRRIWTDSPAAGKYRSGATYSSLIKIHRSPLYNMVSSVHSDKIFDNQGMCGGYPGPSPRFHHVNRDTNIADLAADKQPLPHVEGDPSDPDLKRLVDGEFYTVDGVFLEQALKNDDIHQFFYNTAGGYGDPIERDPQLARKDLDHGIQSASLLQEVHGIVADYDGDSRRHVIDLDATEKRRAEIRHERLERAVPVAEWIETQRRKIQQKDFVHTVKDLYDDVFRISPRWAIEYREFWKLPEGFDFGTDVQR